MCLDDAYDNLLNAMTYNLTLVSSAEKNSDLIKTALVRHLRDRFYLIRQAMDFIANLGRQGPGAITRMPVLEVAIARTDEALQRMLIQEGKFRPQDAYIPGGSRLMGTFPLRWVVRVEDARNKIESALVERLLRLIDLFNGIMVRQAAVKLNTSMRSDTNLAFPLVNYPKSLTPEKLMAEENLGPRRLWESSSVPAEWMSDFGPAVEDSMASIHFGVDSPTSKQAMKRETDELFSGYQNFPGFSELFCSTYGFSVGDFRKVTDALERMSLARTHHLYKGLYQKIERDASKISGVSRDVARKVIHTLMWHPGTLAQYSPLIKLHSLFAFTLQRMRIGVYWRLEGAFLEYDNNLKGEAFENSCRQLVSSNGLSVYPGRLKVDQQVLSEDESNRIWGRKKIGTDFDVIASKGKYLLVIECKERKMSTSRKTRLINMMHRYMDELDLKSQWLANNLLVLKSAPEFWNTTSENVTFIISLIVCNSVVDEFGPPLQLLSFRELSHALRQFDFNAPPYTDGTIDLPLGEDRTIRVACKPLSGPQAPS